MIRFLDPAFLFGLLAVAVPLVLHLLHRRRVPVLEFPLMRLVEKAERTRQPRRMLNRILLLLTRMALLALLALALARTTLGPEQVAVAAGPVATVIVLDDSLSMDARDAKGRSAFEIGRQRALELVDALPDGSQVAVLVASDAEASAAKGLSADLDVARAALARAMPTLRRVRLSQALRAASGLLSTSSLADTQVVLVSDMARHAFEGLDLPRRELSRPRLVPLVPLPPLESPNWSLSGVSVEDLPDGRLRVSVRVSSWGAASQQAVPVELHVGAVGETPRLAAKGEVTAGAAASAERRFEIAAPSEGLALLEARLAGDELPADDVRVALHQVAGRPRLLVVDGDPQNLAIGSETFYVEKALSPEVGLDLASHIVTLADLSPEDLSGSDAILLCNVPDLSLDRVAALTQAIEGGTGLIVALGNRVDQRVFNGRLSALLPATLGLPRVLADALPAAGPNVLGARAHVHGLFTLEPAADATVLLSLSDGSPLLVSGRAGLGRTLLFASTLDRDWNDIAIQPGFLPFLRGMVERVTSRRSGTVLPPVFVGEPIELALPEGAPRPLRALLSNGSRESVPAEGAFTETDVPGALLFEDGAGVAVLAAAVVPDPAESDLARLSPEELGQVLGPAFDAGAAASGEGGSSGGWPAWKWLLVLLVVLALAEALLARRST